MLPCDFPISRRPLKLKETEHNFKSITEKNIDLTAENDNAAVPLSNFDELKKLHDDLIQFNPVSIDAFLRDHPSHTMAGRIMIIYSLLADEDTSKFDTQALFPRGDKKRPKGLEEIDDWYRYLLNVLVSSCGENPNNLINNKISFITFNYDMSLDYYLYHRLKNIEKFKKENSGENFWRHLISTKIQHVYGQLYLHNNIEKYGSYKKPGYLSGPEDKTNAKRFLLAFNNLENISPIRETQEANSEFVQLIMAAKEIIVIGFGFDWDNLNLLGFPQKLKQYKTMLEWKDSIKWLNFNGSMSALTNQFNKLEELFEGKLQVVTSTTNKVVNAYQNDFKNNLFLD